jgi:hypothetical protein
VIFFDHLVLIFCAIVQYKQMSPLCHFMSVDRMAQRKIQENIIVKGETIYDLTSLEGA